MGSAGGVVTALDVTESHADRIVVDLADRKRGTLELLYRADPRVRRWTGTAHGVLQAVNTYEHHAGAVRGDRVDRNNLKTVNGNFGQLDRRAWKTLQPLVTPA